MDIPRANTDSVVPNTSFPPLTGPYRRSSHNIPPLHHRKATNSHNSINKKLILNVSDASLDDSDSSSTPTTAQSSSVHSVTPRPSRYISFGKRAPSNVRITTFWHLVVHITKGFLMIDHVNFTAIVTWILAYFYLPAMAVILAITVNCALQELHTLFFPLLLSKEPFAWSSFSNVWLPHVGVSVSLLVSGYKMLGIFGDALIDAVKTGKDERTGVYVPYYALLLDLLCVTATRARQVLFSVVLLSILTLLHTFLTPLIVTYEGTVRNTALSLYAVIAGYSTLRLLGLQYGDKDGVGVELFTVWWGRSLPVIRDTCFWVLSALAIFTMVDNGATFGMAAWIEGVLYLIVPHLVLISACTMTKFWLRAGRDVAWWLSRAQSKTDLPILLFMLAPWLTIGAQAVYTCGRWESAVLMSIPGLFIFKGVTKYVRHRHVLRATGNTESGVSIINAFFLLYTFNPLAYRTVQYEKTYSSSHKRRLDFDSPSPHRRDSTTVRVILRSLGFGAAVLTLGLGLGVVIQSTASYKKEEIMFAKYVNPNDDSTIAVHATTLHAFMQGTSSMIDEKEVTDAPTSSSAYDSMCSRRFGTNQDVHIGDLAYFNFLSYFEYNNDFNVLLQFYRRYRQGENIDWEVAHFHNTDISTGARLVFYEFHSKSLNSSIISIRGTDPSAMSDLLQNVSMYLETFLFQLMAMIFPGSSVLPERVIVDFIYLASRVEAFAQEVWSTPESERRHYWQPVYTHARRVASRTNLLAVTGHSLGGSIAGIVASHMQVPGIAFSSPGIVLSRKKFGIARHQIDSFFTNIITTNDIVPSIDKQGGTIYNMKCEYQRGDLCHAMELHVFRAWTLCRSMRETMFINGKVEILPQAHETLYQWLSGREWSSSGEDVSL